MNNLAYIDYCPLCGCSVFVPKKKETELIKAADGCYVVKCKKCGFTLLNPQKISSYAKQYFENFKEKSTVVGGTYELADYLKERLAKAERMVVRGRLLEIGFAEGFFLNYAKNRGWEVYGVEKSKWAMKEAVGKFGLPNLYNKKLTEVHFTDSYFDFIHMNHVLEHMPNLSETLKEIRRILKPRGILMVEVPNEFCCLLDRFIDLVGLERKPYEIPSPHLWFFSPGTLAKLMRKYGFEVRQVTTVRRNKELASRYFGGGVIKGVIYLLEDMFLAGPLIELAATKLK